MDFTEVVNKRRTSRQWLDKEVDFEAIKRILEAGNKAPTWDHHRSWQYIVLRTDEEKEYAFEHAKKIAGKFNAERYLNAPRPYPITLGQKMYGYAMPRQFTMLKDAPYVVIPVFKMKNRASESHSSSLDNGRTQPILSKQVAGGESFSRLNSFATAWSVIENIFLAATNEGLSCSMRIPLNEEHDIVKAKLKVPATYIIPCFIGIGYPDPNEPVLEQYQPNVDEQIRFGRWR